MSRLPVIGGDEGSWGEVLNDYLGQSHDADGTLKPDTVGAPQLKPSSVTAAALAPHAVIVSKLKDAGLADGPAVLDGTGKLPVSAVPMQAVAESSEMRAAILTQATTGDVLTFNDGRYLTNGAPIARSIESGLGSTAMTFIGDSLDNEDHEAYPLLIAAVASSPLAAPFEVREQRWDHENQRMPRPVRRKAGPGALRHVPFAGVTDQSPKWTVVAAPTADLDIRALVEPTSWNAGGEQVLLSHFPAAPNRAWNFSLSASGALNFQWSTDGTSLQTIATSGAWTAGSGTVWVRVTLDVDNGTSGHDIKFWRSTDGETWTQIGPSVTRSGTTSLFASAAPMQIGERGSGTGKFIGKIYEVSVRDGIGDAAEITPNLPEHWKSTPATPSPVGSPILTFVNSAHPGANFSYLADDVRLQKLLPMWGTVTMGYRSSHNEQSVHGEELRQTLLALDAKVNLRYPSVAKFIDTENPRITPATRQIEQALRRTEYITWAAAWGWRVMDGYGAFLADPRGLAALLNTDGFHPNAEGSKLRARLLANILGLAVIIP